VRVAVTLGEDRSRLGDVPRHQVAILERMAVPVVPEPVAAGLVLEQLFSVMPTPVVALNRAIAVAEVEGPGPALVMIDAIAQDLENYHLLHAARGTILRRLGRREDARAAFERAADLVVTEADRRILARQIES
jgi:predicted RNA polymerase sigma factor